MANPRLVVIASMAVASACNGAERPPRPRHTGDILVYDSGADPSAVAPKEKYVHLAVRALSAVGLAEARGLDTAVARAAVEKMADALEACVTDLARGGPPPEGAARLVADVLPDGTVGGASLTPEPDTGPVLATGKLCLEARVKLTAFPPGDGKRGFAVEAMWGALVAKPK